MTAKFDLSIILRDIAARLALLRKTVTNGRANSQSFRNTREERGALATEEIY